MEAACHGTRPWRGLDVGQIPIGLARRRVASREKVVQSRNGGHVHGHVADARTMTRGRGKQSDSRKTSSRAWRVRPGPLSPEFASWTGTPGPRAPSVDAVERGARSTVRYCKSVIDETGPGGYSNSYTASRMSSTGFSFLRRQLLKNGTTPTPSSQTADCSHSSSDPLLFRKM
jgi:hypothetical protein